MVVPKYLSTQAKIEIQDNYKEIMAIVITIMKEEEVMRTEIIMVTSVTQHWNISPQTTAAMYYLLMIIANKSSLNLFCCRYNDIMHNHESLFHTRRV